MDEAARQEVRRSETGLTFNPELAGVSSACPISKPPASTIRPRLRLRRPDHPTRATLAYRRASDAGRSVELMNRAEARLHHQFNSAFDRLIRLQSSQNPVRYD